MPQLLCGQCRPCTAERNAAQPSRKGQPCSRCQTPMRSNGCPVCVQSKPCKKCGTIGRLPSGACRSCKAARDAILRSRLCPRCQTPMLGEGYGCPKCVQTEPCKKCGKTDRAPSGGCRPCKAARDEFNYNLQRHRENKYGVTEEEQLRVWALQNGCCGGCGDRFDEVNVKSRLDHSHITLEFKGFLCHACNVSEGLMRTIERLKGLIRYLENPPALRQREQ
jgi:hypothetical protein